MAINLLPSEEKTKADKAKSTPRKVIAMTGPSRREKKRSSVKRGGVLTFFKGAFRKPTEQPQAGQDMQVPEHKVKIEEHVRQAQPQSQEKPKITYQKTQPTATQAHKPAQPLSRDRGGFIARLFRRETANPEPAATPTAPAYDPEAEQFPKYSTIKAEKISGPSERLKKRNGDVITVTTPTPEPVDREAEKSTERRSFFGRMVDWFRSLFARQAQEAPALPAVPADTEKDTQQPSVSFVTEVQPEPTVVSEKKVSLPPPPPAPVVSQPEQKPSVAPVAPPPPPPPAPKPEPKKQEAVPVSPIELVAEEKSNILPKPEPKKDADVPMPPPPPVQQAAHVSLWARIKGMFSRSGKSEKGGQPTASALGKSTGDVLSPQAGLNWEVNLVPEEALEQEISISRVLSLATFAIIAAGLVFGGWLWANWYYNSITTSINKISNDITIADIQISSYQNLQNEVSSLRQQIDDVQTLLDKHVYWSSIFTQIEQHTTPDVYFTNMTADVNGSIQLSAVGKNYDAAIKQLMVLQAADTFVTSVTVSDIAFQSVSEGTTTAVTTTVDAPVTFSISMTVTPQVFYFPASL